MRSVKTFCLLIIVSSFSVLHAGKSIDTLFAEGEYKTLIEEVEKNIEPDKRDVNTWVLLGISYVKEGYPADSVCSVFNRVIKKNPSEPRAFTGLGICAFKKEDYETALKHFQRSYVLNRTAIAAEGIAKSSVKLGYFKKARDAAESAVALDTSLIQSRIILSDICLKDKEYKQAADHLEKIVKRFPDNVKYWQQLAECYLKTGNKNGLVKTDPNIIRLDSGDVAARKRFAEYSRKKKDVDKAYELYKQLALLVPDEAEVFKNLYRIALEKNLKKDAVLYLKNYVVLDSTDAEAFKKYGNLLYESGDEKGALAAYRKAVKLEPDIKGVYKNYSKIALENEKLENEAAHALDMAVKLKEADMDMYIKRADLYLKNNNYSDAEKYYEIALSKDPKNIYAMTKLAETQRNAGKLNETVLTYEQIVMLNDKSVEEYKHLGDIQRELGKEAEAVENYKKYLKKTKSDEKIARLTGLFENSRKNYKDAIKYLTMVKDEKLKDMEYLTKLADSYYNTQDYKKASEIYALVLKKNPPASIKKMILKPLGQSYQKTGDKKNASEAYDMYTRLSGVKDGDISYLKAFLREESDEKEAAGMYEENIRLFPRDKRNYFRLGVIYSKDKGMLNKAASNLNSALKIDPDDKGALQLLGTVYNKIGNDEKELETYMKLLALNPSHKTANRRTGLILYDKKEYKKSLPKLELTHKNEPDDKKIIELLADSYYNTGNYKEAYNFYSMVKKDKSSDPQIRINLINSAEKAGMKESAETEKKNLAELDKKLLEKDKKNIESRERYSDYCYKNKKYDEAYKVYKELSSLKPEDKTVFLRLYKIAEKKENKNELFNYLGKYLELDPENAEMHIKYGNLAYNLNKQEKALEAYRTALKIDPDSKGFYENYASIAVSKGLTDEAVKALNGSIKNSEADNQTYITLGDIYRKEKKYQSALKMYQEASSKDLNNTEVLTSLAELQAITGDINGAIITYEQIILIKDKPVKEMKALAELQENAGQKTEAVKTYKKYLAEKSGDSEIARKMGYYEYDHKNYKDAVKYFGMVKDDELKDAKYYVSNGISNYEIKNYKEAASAFIKARKRDLSVAAQKTILKPLAISLEETGDKKGAAEAYGAYTELPGIKDGEASYKMAALIEDTDEKKAAAIYKKNTGFFPKDFRNFYRLGLIYLKQKDNLKNSASMLKSASALKPESTEILEKLAGVYNKMNDKNNEHYTWKKLLELDREHLKANERAGLLNFENKNYADAIKNLEIVNSKKPGQVEIMMPLAQSYIEIGKNSEAVLILKAARKIKGNDREIGELLYGLYKKTGKADSAEAEIKNLIKLTNENKYRVIYAGELLARKRYDNAYSVAEDIRKDDPENIEAFMIQGRVLIKTEKYDQAVETFKMVSFIDDLYAPAYYERGNAYFLQGNLDRAESTYQRAVKSEPEYAGGYIGLAKVAQKKKDEKAYKENMAKARKLDPKHPDL